MVNEAGRAGGVGRGDVAGKEKPAYQHLNISKMEEKDTFMTCIDMLTIEEMKNVLEQLNRPIKDEPFVKYEPIVIIPSKEQLDKRTPVSYKSIEKQVESEAAREKMKIAIIDRINVIYGEASLRQGINKEIQKY